MAKRIKDIQDLIGFYEAAGKNDKEVEIRYAGLVKGLYNGLKNMQGKLEGFVKYDLVDQEGRPGERAPRLDQRRSRPGRRSTARPRPLSKPSSPSRKPSAPGPSSSTASSAARPSCPRPTTSSAPSARSRSPTRTGNRPIQERNLPRLKQGIQLAERGYVFATDRELLKWTLKRLKAAHPDIANWPPSLKGLAAGTDAEVAARVDADVRQDRRWAIRRKGSSSSDSSRPSSPRSTIPSSSSRRGWSRSSRASARRARAWAAKGPTSRWPTKRPSWR